MTPIASRILLADQDEGATGPWRAALEREGYSVTLAPTGPEAFEASSRAQFDYAVIDARLLEGAEASLLHFLLSRSPAIRLVIVSTPADAAQAMRAGQQVAALSLLKPVRAEDLTVVLNKLRASAGEEEATPAEAGGAPFVFHGVVGQSAIMRRVLRLAAKVAPTDSTVIITGETGTGKELVARVIQQLSRRADKPFITVNCGAIPANLVESELFGHKRGAFTDAVQDKKGLLEMAHQGTILLDEIGELPLGAQVKLLRALDQLEIRRVGDTAPIRVDARVLAATNRDLFAEVQAGRFREDLWFRLNVVQIHLPPLRERREDIPALLRLFLNEANRKFNKTVVGLAPEALGILGRYEFPGNVRELRNVVEHGVVMADREVLRVEDLPVQVVAGSTKHRLLTRQHGAPTISVEGQVVGDAGPAVGAEGYKTIAEAEKELIRWTLQKLDGNQTEVAKKLGISRSTLWRKIKEYGLTV